MKKQIRASRPSAKKSRTRGILMIAGVLLIAGIAASLFAWHRHDQSASATVEPQPGHTINFAPATDEEKQESAGHKDDDAKTQDTPTPLPTDDSGKKVVTPTVTYAGQTGNDIEITALVSGIVEEGGTCTMTATFQGKAVTRQTTGVMNASNTNCKTFMVTRSDFPAAGAWSVVVSYQSNTAKGSSASAPLEIK